MCLTTYENEQNPAVRIWTMILVNATQQATDVMTDSEVFDKLIVIHLQITKHTFPMLHLESESGELLSVCW